MKVSGCIVLQEIHWSSLYSRSFLQACGGYVMLWWTFSWVYLGSVVVVGQYMKATNYMNITAEKLHPIIVSALQNGDRVFEQDNTPCHRGRIVMEWFQEYNTELQLRFCPPNSTALTPIKHIWGIMKWLFTGENQLWRNISDFRGHCLNIWSICHRQSTKNLWYPY